jgi:Kef-type K+ transport system membrane component KefB
LWQPRLGTGFGKSAKMRKYRNILFYIVVTGVFALMMYFIILNGKYLESAKIIIHSNNSTGSRWGDFLNSIYQNFGQPVAILLAQIVTIVFAARIFSWLFKTIGQPSVIGEIVAGIFLGPSVLGLFFPEISNVLFPKESMGNLQILSQFGLILFMFIVGVELDFKSLKGKASDAVVISHASIIVPFTFGLGLAYLIYPSFAPKGVPFLSFGLFIGIAMSITAFPVLARIVHEKEIHKTRLGILVITCAAIDDITAWCLLAAVIAIVKAGSFVSSLFTIALSFLYFLAMVRLVRPFLKRISELYPARDYLSKQVVAIFFFVLILSSYTTELIGIHALFGAFVAGTIIPGSQKFKNQLIEKVEDVALVLLLPLFFVFTGLRTQVGLLNDSYLWQVAGLIIFVAVTGKFLGGTLSARFVGQSWSDSLTIGTLMNTRGLMELVVLNIGYDLGILSPEIFSMMIIMALVTTFMTGPVLHVIKKSFSRTESQVLKASTLGESLKVLVSFGNPEKGKILLRLVNCFIKKPDENSPIDVMHLSRNDELNQVSIDEYESESFRPIVEEAGKLDLKVNQLFKVTNSVYSGIVQAANKGQYNLLLVGIGQSIYRGSFLGGVIGLIVRGTSPNLFSHKPFEESTRYILKKSKIPVGIFVNKDFSKAENIIIPVADINDVFLLKYANLLAQNPNSKISFIDILGNLNSSDIKGSLKDYGEELVNKINFFEEEGLNAGLVSGGDLILVSLESWKKLAKPQYKWLINSASVLIIRE